MSGGAKSAANREAPTVALSSPISTRRCGLTVSGAPAAETVQRPRGQVGEAPWRSMDQKERAPANQADARELA
jgi:hypothetical protein